MNSRTRSHIPPQLNDSTASQWFDQIPGPRFERPWGPRLERSLGPRFERPWGPRFERPWGPQFERPSGPWFERPSGPRPFDGYRGQYEPPYWQPRPETPPDAAMNLRPPDPSGPTLNSHPPTNLQRYELFEKALMCGEKTSAKTYLAIYWLDFKEPDAVLHSPLFENDKGKHAEAHLLTHLTLQLSVISPGRLKSITIMQNSSPCSSCADQYTEALGQDVMDSGVERSIIFSSFHWVRRESCGRFGHNHKRISDEKHEGNVRGLKNMRDAGLTLRTTSYEDWVRLCTALQVPQSHVLPPQLDYCICQRGREDENLEQDLKHILR